MQDEDNHSLSPVAIVGAGAVGTALAHRLNDSGYPVRAVLSRDAADASKLAEKVGAVSGTLEDGIFPSEIRLVLICVPDDAIPDVARSLAGLDHAWDRTLVGHTSGQRTQHDLEALSEVGAETFSFHPLQTFAPETPPEAFADIAVAIEGDSDAVVAAKALAKRLGAHPLVISARDKTRYHCAAALASNGLVALMAVVEELLPRAAAPDAPSAASLMAPLVEQTWRNLKEASPESVLTGPVARGDFGTVEAHLGALREENPHLIPLYAALSTEMTRVAVRGGHLNAEDAEDMLQLLRSSLEASDDGANSSNASH